MKVAIIGGGNMGSAIAAGLIKSGTTDCVALSSPRQVTLDRIAAMCPGALLTLSNTEVVGGADVVILAVKPWVVPGVLAEIAPLIDFRNQVIVSLAAGISLADLNGMLHQYSSRRTLMRAIPNTAMLVGRSMTFVCHDDTASDSHVEAVKSIFAALGRVDVIPERLMPAATALCSCGIAYALRYIRAASEGGVQLGFYPDKAKEYVMATLEGAVALLEATGSNPESEIDKVTTPGGVTIRGLNTMEACGFTNAVVRGLVDSAGKA